MKKKVSKWKILFLVSSITTTLILLFYIFLVPTTQYYKLSVEQAKDDGCQILISNNCNISTDSILVNFDANQNGEIDDKDTLFDLCKIYIDSFICPSGDIETCCKTKICEC